MNVKIICQIRGLILLYNKSDMKKTDKKGSKPILFIFLSIMVVMIIIGITFYSELKTLLSRSRLYPHALFVHIISVTIFFANAVVGMLWEHRSLSSGRTDVILHTYDTVAWLDARFSSPLIIIAVTSGVILTLILGDIWKIGWLLLAFILFILSGTIWIVSDIPTQYRVKKLMSNLAPSAEALPDELMRLLRLRLKISLAGVIPLVAVFFLMVYKPGFSFTAW